MFKSERYYHTNYLGEAGVTETCLYSLCNLIQTNTDLSYALLLTNDQSHGFILTDQSDSYYIIRSGFTSGYPGEGPKGLAKALTILNKHQIDTEEVMIPAKLMNKVNNSSLCDNDIDFIFREKVIRPIRLHDYIYPFQNEVASSHLKRYYPLELPYSIVDDRIFDLALLFKQDPDSALTKAYKRLEDIVRERTGLNEHSTKLFSQAFIQPNSPLSWDMPDKSEIMGRASLFTGTYQAFRNARTHREKPEENLFHQYREFLLINELYLLEAEAKNIR